MSNVEYPGRCQVDDLVGRAAAVELLLTDVDGVMTRGEIYADAAGVPLKLFNVKDGMGLFLLGRAGIARGVITGKTSEAVRRRCAELQLEFCRQGVIDKGALLEGLLGECGCRAAEYAYIGDDLNDLPLLERAGLACCPADAVVDVRRRVHYVCAAPGGGGVVREVCELVLRAKGLWAGFVEAWRTGFKQEKNQ